MLINKKNENVKLKKTCIFYDLKAIGIFLQECKNSEM